MTFRSALEPGPGPLYLHPLFTSAHCRRHLENFCHNLCPQTVPVSGGLLEDKTLLVCSFAPGGNGA